MNQPIKPSVMEAKVLAHSRHLSSILGPDLITLQLEMSRTALAELNTYRVFSRNSASSRAIPAQKMLDRVRNNPFIPRKYSINQKGMHANEFIDYEKNRDAWNDITLTWYLPARDRAVEAAEEGIRLGIHKQDVNRLLEPFMMHTVILTSTEWVNLFDQRLAVDSQGDPLAYVPFYDLTLAIKEAIRLSHYNFTYTQLSEGHPLTGNQEWHTPLTGFDGDEDLSLAQRLRVSVARCARVSYLTQENKRDVEADLGLYDRLLKGNHLSPFEHVAHPSEQGSGNFKSWKQLRYYVERGITV